MNMKFVKGDLSYQYIFVNHDKTKAYAFSNEFYFKNAGKIWEKISYYPSIREDKGGDKYYIFEVTDGEYNGESTMNKNEFDGWITNMKKNRKSCRNTS